MLKYLYLLSFKEAVLILILFTALLCAALMPLLIKVLNYIFDLLED